MKKQEEAKKQEQADADRRAQELEARRQAEQAERQKAEAVALQKKIEAEQKRAEEIRLQEQAKLTQQALELKEKQAQEEARQKAAALERQQQEQAAQQKAQEQAEAQAQQARDQAQAQQQARDQAARRKAEADADAQRAAAAATSSGNTGSGNNTGSNGSSNGANQAKAAGTGRLAASVLDQISKSDFARDDPTRIAESKVPNPRRASLFGNFDHDIGLKFYIQGWRLKIERTDNLNYSQSSKDKMREDPIVTVSIRSDGSVEDIHFERYSGRRDIDEAVKRIVALNTPFSAFPHELALRYDVIPIRMIWNFDDRLRLLEEPPQ